MLNLNILVQQCCAKYNIPKELFFKKTRLPEVVSARQDFVQACREAGMKFKEIGDFLGMDHSSIIYLARERVKPARHRENPLEAYLDIVRKEAVREAECGKKQAF